MRLCHGALLRDLIDTGKLIVETPNHSPHFLDDFRLGLRLKDTMNLLHGTVNISVGCAEAMTSASLSTSGLQPNQWCLGQSVEKLAVGEMIFGTINTRSKYARLGLELAGSSCLIAPGFGKEHPANLVFEIRTHHRVIGFDEQTAYAFAMFFEIDEPLQVVGSGYNERFPFRTP